MSALAKYQDSLHNAPARGQGLHQHILRIAMLGRIAELDKSVIVKDCQTLPKIRQGEAEEAVAKAFNCTIERNEYKAPPFEPSFEGALDRYIKDSSTDEMDLLESSPNRLHFAVEKSGIALLETLYHPDEYLFIGSVYDKTVKRVRDWLESSIDFPHIIPNPMTGEFAITGNGAESRRCEGTVADLRYAVCEMDGVPLEKQVAFWNKAIKKLPVAAVIHSGGKSLHGWIKVDCGTDAEKWDKDVKGWLFGQFGRMYGFDKACSNKARLSRMPAHLRENGKRQVLLYLNGDLK